MAGNKHEHHNCDHKIEYCLPCNEAYCTECATIFTNTPCMEQHYPWYYNATITYPSTTTTVTCETGDDVDFSSSSCIVMNDEDINCNISY